MENTRLMKYKNLNVDSIVKKLKYDNLISFGGTKMKKYLLTNINAFELFACTRGANSVVDQQDNNNNIGTQASSTLLWSSVGANNQSNNTVSEQLPLNISSDPFEVAAEGNGFKVYSSPVIFKGADNNIYVIALWAKSGESKLVKYTYNAGSLTADASFNVSLTPASEFKTHQVILSKEDGDVFIYVSHKDGVDKYSATEVKQLTFGNADDSVSALLVDNQNLYVQLADGVKKYSTTSGQELNAVTFSGGSDSPERVLPMVVSGDFLYVAQPNTIYKLCQLMFLSRRKKQLHIK